MAIIQFLPAFRMGDAIGNYTWHLHNIIRSWGVKSSIFCQYFNNDTIDKAHYYKKYDNMKNPDDIIIYHFSIGSLVTDYVLDQPNKKILVYHNITPGEYFKDYSPILYREVKKGRQELLSLKDKFDIFLSDSEYNKKELDDAGFHNSHVLPLTIDWDDMLKITPCPYYYRMFNDGKTNILFTGKVSPQKKIDELIRVFYFYKKIINPDSRLIIMGDKEGLFSHYYLTILSIIKELALKDIVFTGYTDQRQWASVYKASHLFLSLSSHEGFCVPLMEAMASGIPVISSGDCALQYTLGYGGVLLKEKDSLKTAFLIDRILKDNKLKAAIIDNQYRWYKEYKNRNISKILKGFIDKLQNEN